MVKQPVAGERLANKEARARATGAAATTDHARTNSASCE